MAKLRVAPHSGFIESEADIRLGVKALRRKCAVIRLAHDLGGDPPLRRRAGGFEGLANIIVAQQLSVASAGAIWQRLRAAADPMTAATLSALDDAALKAVGLSAPKIKTLRAAAEAVSDNRLRIDEAHVIAPEALREQLIAVRGIGPWTADIFEMFCVGYRDAFAPGDLALQVAAQIAMELSARPTADELADIAERWRPWRGVAARVLWAYYRVARSARSGAPV